MMNKFISVHALGFVWYNMVHMTNWVLNALPERFPKLKVIWIESGLAWLPFMIQRLDNEYMMRSSECPGLKKLPGEYITDMFYTSQPMEIPRDMSLLEATFKCIKAESQLLYSSDYPHWDFDLPSTIYDLPFLKEKAKRDILGGNAVKLFKLDIGARQARQGGVTLRSGRRGRHGQQRVIIIGGGPVGMALALNLAALGVRSVLINRETGPRWHPKGSTQNARTMEHYRRLGIVEKIRAARPAARPADRRDLFHQLDGLGAGAHRHAVGSAKSSPRATPRPPTIRRSSRSSAATRCTPKPRCSIMCRPAS